MQDFITISYLDAIGFFALFARCINLLEEKRERERAASDTVVEQPVGQKTIIRLHECFLKDKPSRSFCYNMSSILRIVLVI